MKYYCLFMNVVDYWRGTFLYKVFNEDLYGINTNLKFKYTWSQVLAYEWQDDAIRQWLADQSTPPDDTTMCFIGGDGERHYDTVENPYKMHPLKLEDCRKTIEERDICRKADRVFAYKILRITSRDKLLPRETSRYWTNEYEEDDMLCIRARCILLKQELIAAVLHPDRIEKLGDEWLDAT